MNVLIVSQYFWPEAFRINDIAIGLQERGHSVRVLTGLPNYPAGKLFDGYSFLGPYSDQLHQVPIIRAPLVPRGAGGGLRLALNYFSFAASASIVGALRCRQPVDVILVYEPSPVTVGLPALVLKFIWAAPVIFWVQDLWPQSLEATGAVRSKAMLRGVDSLVRWIYRHCDRVLVQSQAFVRPVRQQGVPAEKIGYLPNTAESFYRPVAVELDAPERAELPEGFRIVFAGNIGASQDFPTVLSAAEMTRDDPDIHWIIFGDGRLKGWVEGEIAARGLQSTFHLLGSREAHQMPRYFALADALLVTLRREAIFSYTIPSKIQSYLGCGRPVIAALEGEGARVIEEAGAGYVVPSQDPCALANAARRLRELSHRDRQNMGKSGAEYFTRHFERSQLLDQLEGWITEVSGRRS